MKIDIRHSHLRLSHLAPNNSGIPTKKHIDKSERTLWPFWHLWHCQGRVLSFVWYTTKNSHMHISPYPYPFTEQKPSAFNFLFFLLKYLFGCCYISCIMYLIEGRRLLIEISYYFILTEIYRMKNSYGNFFHPITVANRLSHTWEKPFHPIRNQLSECISQFANAFTLFLAPLEELVHA